MIRKNFVFLFVLLILALVAACSSAIPTPLSTYTPMPSKPTKTPPNQPTRPLLPTKTARFTRPTSTDISLQAQPTTQEEIAPLPLGRKFENISPRILLCVSNMIWGLSETGLVKLDVQTLQTKEFPISNLNGGPWAASDWIWTYEYLSDADHTGGFLIGRDPHNGQIEKYLDMNKILLWETFLLGMGEVGGEYWITTSNMQTLLIDKLSGEAVGQANLPGVAYRILYSGNEIWFAGDTLFVMDTATQKFSTIIEDSISGLDFDGWNIWILYQGVLLKTDPFTKTWVEFPISPSAWAGCYASESSYWYSDVDLNTVQEILLP